MQGKVSKGNDSKIGLIVHFKVHYINSRQADCSKEEIYVIPGEKLLTRLEVYNSLGVIAPQIDLQSDRRYNVTG